MIELKNLSAGYGGRTVVRGVTLSFPPGRVTALCGPNGCGKSTLLKAALGLMPREGGEVYIDGEPLASLTPRERARRAAYLPQERGAPSISVRRLALHGRFPYLGWPRRYTPGDRAAAERALERADALDMAERLLPELSGGQRQRAFLAQALAQETANVLMDEPTAFLDIARQLAVMDTARSLAQEGRCVVMVLHDLGLALRRADTLAVMDDGGIAACGTPEEVYASGAIDAVFKVRTHRAASPGGWQYYFE